MRKILALFLVVALVPFLTGCRIDGLWGYDDDDTVAAVQTTPVTNATINVNLAGQFANPSIRQALSNPVTSVVVQYLPVNKTDVDLNWVNMTASTTNAFIFWTNVNPANIANHPTISGAKRFRIKFIVGGKNIDLPLPVVTEVNVSRSSTEISMTFSVVINETTLVATISVASNDSGMSVSGTTTGGAVTDVSSTNLVLATATVTCNGVEKALSVDENHPTELATNTVDGLVFNIGFNTNIASLTDDFEFELDRLPGMAKTTITETDTDKICVSGDGTNNVEVTINVAESLTAATHKITLKQSSIVSAATPTIKLSDSLPLIFYIKSSISQ